MAPNSPATRDLLLAAAKRLFAERGFYGASIAAIAEDLGITKQALLHHFGSKERLYGEVLERISNRYQQVVETGEKNSESPEQALNRFFETFYEDAIGNAEETRIIVRELLDNRDRANTAETWYLKPFLDALTTLTASTAWGRSRNEAQARAAIYQLLGAATYFAISEPTLQNMFGRKPYAEMKKAFPSVFRQLVDGAFDTGKA